LIVIVKIQWTDKNKMLIIIIIIIKQISYLVNTQSRFLD